MSFDKIKAMRNAERYLSQGKIKAAIGEYKQVVENDLKDFSTLNMLGDLYAKNSEKQEAINCFTRVAEHYGNQGFAQKAIAVYNKISRIQPNSMEVSAKLAELYHSKGSFAEARTHYVALAEQYQRSGRKIEALGVWKQIAGLDPANTQVYLKIAESYRQENQADDAADAYNEAGTRLLNCGDGEAALDAFAHALEIRADDLNALGGMVRAHISLGDSDEAVTILETAIEKHPYNQEMLFLLIDCHLATDNPHSAEKVVVRLVEQEPANYPKFLELVEAYIRLNDLGSAARVLAMSSESLLIGGQAEDFLNWTNEILSRNPEYLDAQRLLIVYHGWNRDEEGLKDSLDRLADTAQLAESVEDEHYALTQLAAMFPQENSYRRRLREISAEYGFTKELDISTLPVAAFLSDAAGDAETSEDDLTKYTVDRFGEYHPHAAEPEIVASASFETNGFEIENFEPIKTAEPIIEALPTDAVAPKNTGELSAAEIHFIDKELESVEFYISQGYEDLAAKSLDALEDRFGPREMFDALRTQTGDSDDKHFDGAIPATTAAPAQIEIIADEPETKSAPPSEKSVSIEVVNPNVNPKYDFLDDFRMELGLEENEPAAASEDFETVFQMAIAYKEMGLSEEAIREFQDAINLVSPNDGTRRFFQCAHYLGYCFMQKQMANLALLWYQRALETANLNEDEKQGIWYEIGNAYEAEGETDKALETYERIYAVDVDYRDVGARIQSLHVNT